MKKLIKEIIIITIGTILLSVATSALLIPAQIGSGGVTGIALSLNKFFGVKIGIVILVLNLPLFIFGSHLIGKDFSLKSLYVVILYSLLIDIFNSLYKYPTLNDMMLTSIFCGIIFGISMSLVFMYGASTGGIDILAKIIKSKVKTIKLSNILFGLDVFVYILVGIALGPRSVMYAFIMSFVRSKTMDAVQEGLSSSRQCIIICDNPKEIIENITNVLVRGATVIDAVGAYSNNDKKIVYVVIQKNQIRGLTSMIQKIDPNAFVAISQVNDIRGNYRNILPTI